MERKKLDTEKKKGNKGAVKKGEVLNPAGKVPGTLMRSTNQSNEVKSTLIQAFERSLAPQVLVTMLNCKLPSQFLPKYLRDRIENGTLTETDQEAIASMIRKNFWQCNDFIAKILGKTLGVYGLIQTEETLAGRTKQATKETKSPNVIDMVRKRMEKELYEADK